MNIQKEWKGKAGIYKITCNNESYIGSSVNLRERLTGHKSDLKCNRHHSVYMQRCVNKYGLDSVVVDILETCDRDIPLLRSLEDKYIKDLNPKFNSTTPIEYEHSPEMKEKIANTLREMVKDGRWKNPNPKYQNGNRVDIYSFEGNLTYKGLLTEDAIKILNISNRSVINNLIRRGSFFNRNRDIIIPSNKEYISYITDYIVKQKGMLIPIYYIDKLGQLFRATDNKSSEVRNKCLESNSMIYFDSNCNRYYTFIGLINQAVLLRNKEIITAE